MLLKSLDAGVPRGTVCRLIRELQEDVNRKLISGEAMDIEFSVRDWDEISAGDIRNMLSLKTGALLEFCAGAGAVIALKLDRDDNDSVRKLKEFAGNIGIVFQLRDDWLGIFGEQEKLGKPIASDLSEGKPAMLFKDTLDSLSEEDRRRFRKFIGRTAYGEDDLKQIRELIEQSGAERRLSAYMQELINNAKNLLEDFPDNRYRNLLCELADFCGIRSL
jgi:geranylgeranyl diphosphate synthase type I